MRVRMQGFLILGSIFYLTALIAGVIILGAVEIVLIPIGKHLHMGE